MSDSSTRRWGLALSGGAACGLANIGVLEVLHGAGLRPRYIAGSSMGAIVAALYAMGHPPGALRQLARSLAPVTLARLSDAPLRGGLHGGILQQQLDRHLRPLIGDACVGDCSIPFVCVAGRVLRPIPWHRILAADFVQRMRASFELHVFSPHTRLIDALRASSAIPVVFSPVRIDGEDYMDLVHFGPIPTRALRSIHAPEVVIATDTQPGYEGIEPWLPAPLRRFLAAGRQETALSKAACDLLLRPPLPAQMFRFDRGEAFADAGAALARERLSEIRRLLR